MQTYRKRILSVLAGLIVGFLLGVGYTVWKKHGLPVPFYGHLAPLSGLEATCSAGAKPTVLVSWTKELEDLSPKLERSSAGAMKQLAVAATVGGQPHYVDADVVAGQEYTYRLMSNGSAVSSAVTVSVNAASCK